MENQNVNANATGAAVAVAPNQVRQPLARTIFSQTLVISYFGAPVFMPVQRIDETKEGKDRFVSIPGTSNKEPVANACSLLGLASSLRAKGWRTEIYPSKPNHQPEKARKLFTFSLYAHPPNALAENQAAIESAVIASPAVTTAQEGVSL